MLLGLAARPPAAASGSPLRRQPSPQRKPRVREPRRTRARRSFRAVTPTAPCHKRAHTVWERRRRQRSSHAAGMQLDAAAGSVQACDPRAPARLRRSDCLRTHAALFKSAWCQCLARVTRFAPYTCVRAAPAVQPAGVGPASAAACEDAGNCTACRSAREGGTRAPTHARLVRIIARARSLLATHLAPRAALLSDYARSDAPPKPGARAFSPPRVPSHPSCLSAACVRPPPTRSAPPPLPPLPRRRPRRRLRPVSSARPPPPPLPARAKGCF